MNISEIVHHYYSSSFTVYAIFTHNRVKSPLDGRLMSGIESVHIQHATDYAGTSRTIRWTELFFLETSPVVGTPGGICAEPVDLSRLADTLAGAFCVALVPQLDALKTEMLTPLALKVNIHPETVRYRCLIVSSY